LKKPTGSVRFYKPETEKTEPNRTQTEKNQKKSEPNQAKTEPNQAKIEPNKKNRIKPVWTSFSPKKQNRIETDRFEPVFLKKNFDLVIFFLYIKIKYVIKNDHSCHFITSLASMYLSSDFQIFLKKNYNFCSLFNIYIYKRSYLSFIHIF